MSEMNVNGRLLARELAVELSPADLQSVSGAVTGSGTITHEIGGKTTVDGDLDT